MRRITTAFAVIAASLILAACGGGISATTPPALQSGAASETGGMPTAPLPPIHAQRPHALNPLELPLDLALARLPDRGVALFAQDTQEQAVRDLPLELSAEDGAEGLSIAVRTTEEMLLPDNLLLHLRFDPAQLAPVRAEFNESAFAEGSHLLLAVTEAPGYVPLAAAKLPGTAPVTVPAGTELVYVEFAHHAQAASKTVAAAPSGDANKVEVNVSLSGPEQQDINVWFEERNLGDYDLNGTVGIADITPLAVHFGERDGVSLPVIDGSGNNSVGIEDVTQIAVNFGRTLSGYDLEVEFTPEGGSTQAFTRIPNGTNPDLPTLPRPSVSLPSGWPTYNYQLHNADFGQYRLRAVAIGATLAEKGVSSDAGSTTVVNLPPPPPQSFYVSATTRTTVTVNWSQSISTDLLGYNLYITQDSAANELADFTQLNTELLPTTTQELTATELTPTTDYWFVIEAVDDAMHPSLESAVMDTKVLAQTVIAPVAVLNVEPGDHYEMYEISFDADGSSSPDGAELVGFTYNWGDGSPAEEAPPPGEATHTYASPHPAGVTVKLMVTDEYGAEGVAQQIVPVLALRRDVLVVYNSNSADDLEIANYYADRETGRAIHPSCVLGLALPTTQVIDRNTYDSDVRDAIRNYIDNTLPPRESIYYIVTCKNVPLKVSGSSGVLGSQACLDSELCLLFEDYVLEGAIYNPYYGWESSGGMQDKGNMGLSQPWQPLHFTAADPDWLDTFGWDGTGGTTRIDYLVTRLTGYTLEETLQMIDRCVNSYSGSDYYIILDDDNKTIDRMNDPVWPGFVGDESATSVLTRLAYSLYSDFNHQSDLITAAFLNDTNISQNVLGYCSHGYHSAFDGYYILDDLGFGYLPGALFMSYESSNGTTFVWSDTHDVAGQLADFIRMGGSGGVGNVYEPWNLACGDESMMFAEYLGGRNLAEACYKGIIAISWQEVVVGDPLCQVSVN